MIKFKFELFYILLIFITSCDLIESLEDIEVFNRKWITYDRYSNPPMLNDPYIYMNGPYQNMEIKFINPKPNLKLERLSIQFNYWAYWNRYLYPPNERSTELFQLSVIPCHRSAPQVKYVGFNKSFNQWETYSNMITENLEECGEEIIIEIIDNKFNDKINKNSTYKIAIKAIQIKLKYKDILAPQTYYCTSKDDCNEIYFNLNGHKWSPNNLPLMKNFKGYYYSKENDSDLIINLNNAFNKCIDINYYTVHDTILLMKIIDDRELNHGEIQLSSLKKTNNKDEIYGWHQMTLCSSKITLALKESVKIAFSIANNKITEDTLAAIAFLKEEDVKTKIIDNKPKEFFKHWKRGGKYSWYPLNDYFVNDYKHYWFYNNYTNHESFVMSTEPRTSGIGYLYSDWFEFYNDLTFAYLFESNLESELKINTSLLIMENNSRIVDITHLKVTNKDEKLMLRCRKCEIGGKYFLMIKMEYYSPSSKSCKQVTIRNVYLSDACEDGSKCLNTNKECINVGRNDYKCLCNNNYWGKNCEYINYCVNGGYSFCEKRNGKCEKEYYEPKRKVCKCDTYNYWDYDEKCKPLDRCIGIDHFCPGYICNESYINITDICLECDDGYVKVDNICKKSNSCDNYCSNAKCKIINNKPYCYCENGVWSEVNKSCIIINSCTPWDRQKNKCDHDCRIEDNKIVCDCLPGYVLDKNICVPQFSCNDLVCTHPSICVQKNDSKECVCPNGYMMNGTQCIDICTLSKEGDEIAKAQVFRNCESDNCIVNKGLFQCICQPPLFVDEYGLCRFEKPCLPGNKGHQKCSKINALCRPRGTADKNGDFYECYCPEGKKMAKNICLDECEFENECLSKNAICRYSFSKKQNECICRPGFNVVRQDFKCYLSEKASKWQFVMKLLNFYKIRSFDPENSYTNVINSLCYKMNYNIKLECLKYIQEIQKINYEYEMKRRLHYELEYLINKNFESKITNHIFLLDYQVFDKNDENNGIYGKDYLVTVSSTDEFLNFNCSIEFDSADKRHDYCLLPPKILIKRNEPINKFSLLPCQENNIDYCSKNTKCTALSNHHYRCNCLEGYKTETYVELSLTNTNALKAHCVPIEGCKNEDCGQNARCFSVLGRDYCECNNGFRYNESGYCIDICAELDCIHGICYLLNNNTGICRCEELYTGIRCNKINPEIAIIKVYLVAATLFIFTLLFIIICNYFNKKRKAELNKPDTSHSNGTCNYYTQTKF